MLWACAACGDGSDLTRLHASAAAEVTLEPALTPELSAGPSLSGGDRRPEPTPPRLAPPALDSAREPPREPAPGEPPTSALDPEARLDAGAPVSPAAPSPDAGSLPLPCTLRVEWQSWQASHTGCESASGLGGAALAVWDGTALLMIGEEWLPEGNLLERTRRCVHTERTLWRFHERLVLARALPTERCPALPVTASYSYEECPLLSPGTVCAAAEPSACRFSGSVTLTPLAAAAGPDALASPPREASCRPVGQNPRRPVQAGQRCYDGECAAGYFCSRELTGGTCAPLGEGVCSPAPALGECGDVAQAVCLCTTPPSPLRALGLFNSASPPGDAPAANTCTAHALGISVIACPPGDG